MATEITLWRPRAGVKLPKTATVDEMAVYAKQLTAREKSQLVAVFGSGSYEMGSVFLWTRSMAALKNQLSSLGPDFIGEMLDRPEIGPDTPLSQTVTDFEAVKLAEEIGMFGGTQAMRLRHAMELVAHFSEPPDFEGDDDDREMNPEEAFSVLRACVQSVLGHDKLEVGLEFARFRRQLEERTFRESDEEIAVVASAPHFLQSTTVRVLMALLKTTHSAQLEHVTGNVNIVIPTLWKGLPKPDRWLVGRTYAELHAGGQRTAASGLKQALLKVRGFDFVPEDLRSRTFIQAAKKVEDAHNGMNNFFNEAAPMKALAGLGTVIPMPAFQHCMSATLSVRLGNLYGESWTAQDAAASMLDAVTNDRWVYYLEHCLPADRTILLKFWDRKPQERWISQVCNRYDLQALDISKRDVKRLLEASGKRDFSQMSRLAKAMYKRAIKP